MRPRFQADANFHGGVIKGLIRKDPRIDFRTAADLNLIGFPDDKVLLAANSDDRILVSHDLKTMPAHFGTFISHDDSSGVIIVPQKLTISETIESLMLVWIASEHEEYRNRIVFLPF